MKLLTSFTILLFTFSSLQAQSWEDVIITRNNADVEGLSKIKQVDASASKVYGMQSKLRAKATDELKKKAFALGAKMVLVEVDNFEKTPINNVNLVGTAYREEKNIDQPELTLPVINGVSDWEKIIVTRNTEDVQGLIRINEIDASASKVYGMQSKLRTKATEELKKKAADLEGQIILITVDEFSATPINNVNLVGTVYKEK